MIQLAEANSDVHQAVNAGQISGTAALKMVKQHGSRAGAVIQAGLEQAKAEGKEKVTPRALGRRSSSNVTDKQIVDWMVKNIKFSQAYISDKARYYELDLSVPPGAADSDDLRTLIANAISHSTTT